MLIKSLFAALLLLVPTVSAQTKLKLSYESTDASQFGYNRFSNGLMIEASHRRKRWEPVATFNISDQHKGYVGNGYQMSGSSGIRAYAGDFFLTGGASISRDKNTEYTKYALRGFLGGGIEAFGVRATATAFGPPSGLASDPNTVRGITLLMEYERPLAGPLSLYTAAQGSISSFNQTGGSIEERFTGVAWKARAGVTVKF